MSHYTSQVLNLLYKTMNQLLDIVSWFQKQNNLNNKIPYL